MNPKLASVFEEAESRRKSLLRRVSGLSDERFYFSADNKWSISQILVHLIIAEEVSIQYIKKKRLGVDNAGDTNLLDELKYLMLKISQRLPLKYKAPKVLGENGPPSMSLEQITERWECARLDLKKVLQSVETAHLKRKIYKHAVAGRLNILHAVDFFNEHLIHHLPQITRLMNTTR